MERINIADYTHAFTTYPTELTVFATEHAITLPTIGSLQGQSIALLAQPEVRGRRYLIREDTVAYFKAIGHDTNDAIQPFNKLPQRGFVLSTVGKGKYALDFPFKYDATNPAKRKDAHLSGDKDTAINSIKDFWRKNLVDIPNEKWEIGHLRAGLGDASETNLAWQPPIQGKYRDRFNFDKEFMKMWPTTTELIPKFNQYYTKEERALLFEHLKAEFARV